VKVKKIQYRSHNWRADPFSIHEKIGPFDLGRLCFRVVENGKTVEGSRTIFTKPSPELVEEILRLPEKVLHFNDTYQELHNEKDNVIEKSDSGKIYILDYVKDFHLDDQNIATNVDLSGSMTFPKKSRYKSRIIDLGTGETSLFVKGVRFNGINSLFSYDLGIDNISPDRKYVDESTKLGMIKELLEGCANKDVIKKLLETAHEKTHAYLDEFRAFAPRNLDGSLFEEQKTHSYFRKDRHEWEKHCGITEKFEGLEDKVSPYDKLFEPSLWVQVFNETFCEEGQDPEMLVIASDNEISNSDAKLMGYTPIKMNEYIGNKLAGMGIKRADQIQIKQDYRWIKPENLTEEETERLKYSKKINQVVLGEDKDLEIRVYSGLFTETGREINASRGVQITEEDGTRYLGLRRDMLNKKSGEVDDEEESFEEVYIHELGHYETRANDGSREFDRFAFRALGKLTSYMIKESLNPHE